MTSKVTPNAIANRLAEFIGYQLKTYGIDTVNVLVVPKSVPVLHFEFTIQWNGRLFGYKYEIDEFQYYSGVQRDRNGVVLHPNMEIEELAATQVARVFSNRFDRDEHL